MSAGYEMLLEEENSVWKVIFEDGV